MNEQNPVNPKVPAAAIGGGVGVALGEILVYVLERVPAVGDIPGPIEASVVVVVAAALAFLSGYLKRG
jgi:cobalamin biosynthesis protein CobD/CbiB